MVARAKTEITGKDRTQAALASARKGLRALSKGAKIASAATAGLAAATGVLVGKQFELVDSLAKTSQLLNINTESLSSLQRAARRTGVSTEALNMGLQRMVRRLGEAAGGTGEALVAIEALGLNAKQLAASKPEDAFFAIGDALNSVDNEFQKVALAQKFFDSEGVKLINTLKLGTQGFAQISEQTKSFGLAITNIDAAKIEAANDAMGDARDAIRGAATQLAVRLAPFLKAITERFLAAGKQAGGFGQIGIKVFRGITKAVGFAANAVHVLRTAFESVKFVTAGLLSFIAQGFSSVFTRIANVVLEKVNFIRGLFNMDEVQFEFTQTVQNIANALTMTAQQSGEQLRALFDAGLPSDRILAKFDEIEMAAQAHAERMVAIREDTAAKTGRIIDFEAARAKIAERKKENTAKQSADKISQINNALAVDNKAIAIAQAIINTWQGVTKALSQGGFFGIGMAAAVAASGLQAVANIRSQNPTGGGGGGGGVASITSPATGGGTTEGGQGSTQRTLNISISQTQGVGGDQIRTMILSMDEELQAMGSDTRLVPN